MMSLLEKGVIDFHGDFPFTSVATAMTCLFSGSRKAFSPGPS